MSYRRQGSDFTAWLTTLGDTGTLRAQRLASWQGGEESYGFDDAVEEVWEGTAPRILGEKAGGGTGRIGGASATGLPALIADLRDVADRRKAVRAELQELIAKLETPGADLEDIGAALRDLADRRPAARAEVLDLADRLETLRVGPVVV